MAVMIQLCTFSYVHWGCEQVLGAWGLGWEVWMDGMEITQFTYFQQVSFSVYHDNEF